jgi:hypothetical protein
MTAGETEAFTEWVQEELRKGFLRRSKAAYTSPFFFIHKKDENYDPSKITKH